MQTHERGPPSALAEFVQISDVFIKGAAGLFLMPFLTIQSKIIGMKSLQVTKCYYLFAFNCCISLNQFINCKYHSN